MSKTRASTRMDAPGGYLLAGTPAPVLSGLRRGR